MIHVCSLVRLHETVEDTGARHVVSLIGDEAHIERPSAIEAENHLWLRLHDISAPLDGERLRQRLRAQPASRRANNRAGLAHRLAHGDAEYPDRIACRPPALP